VPPLSVARGSPFAAAHAAIHRPLSAMGWPTDSVLARRYPYPAASPDSVPGRPGLVDRFDEGVEFLVGREIGIIPRRGEDLRSSP
jgi:hypothetical protein